MIIQRNLGKCLIKHKLYKHINSKIREIHPGFNIGESTGISFKEERWRLPYSHWSFNPNNYDRDLRVKLLDLEYELNLAFENRKPNYLVDYIYDLCVLVNAFYQNNHIINLDDEIAEVQYS